nr:TolC family protein [Desulfobacterales bacterium]
MSKFIMMSIVIVLVHVFSLVTTGYGADLNDVLTLREALNMALSDNTLITEAIEKEKAAVDDKRSAWADFLPKLSTKYSYTRLKDTPYAIFGPSKIDVGDNDVYHWDVTVYQPIFTGFAILTRYRMAKLGVVTKEIERCQARLEVAKKVKIAYFNILLARELYSVAGEEVTQLESHLRDAERFYEQGMIPYNDLLKSRVALANAKQNRVVAESRVEMAIAQLNTLLRLNINRRTKVEDMLEIPPSSFDLDKLFKEALDNRPELKALRVALKNSDYVTRLAQSSYYPEIALIGTYEQNGDNLEATNNEFGNAHNMSITLQATWRFFEWGKTKAQVSKYRHLKRSLCEKLKGIQNSIKLEVKNAFLNLKVAKVNIKTAKVALDQARENYRITNLQYQQQMATTTDVLDARTFLTQAETNYYGSRYGYMISLAELERAVGKI